jgi:hypothetical protein
MKRLPRLIAAAAVIVCLAVAADRSNAAETNARMAALLSITSQELKDDVGALADDTFEGRESGTRGNRAAGIYIIERLKKMGLEGGGPKHSFYQNFGSYGNILAYVPGRDSELANQVVVISAHFDHVGYGSNRNSYGPIGRIHNGADDNASGVAGLLEVAEALSLLPEKPRRSILIAFWDGEEKGLLGSKHWLENPTVPVNRVAIMFNVDMIGRLRNSRAVVYGTRTSAGLRKLVSRQNDPSQLLLNFSWEMKGDSDHYAFYSREVPVLMLHTGLHDDYHRPSDDADKINAEGLKQISQLMFNVLVELADAPSLSGFRSQSRTETRFDQQTRERGLPSPPGRLGVRIDGKAATNGQVIINSVSAGSAADRAGLRAGDRVLKFAGEDVTDAARFLVNVLATAGPAPATIERPGHDEPLEVTLNLPGEPVRLGISWRADDAEPQAVIINRVVSGSPADLAGLRVNERIYRIGGREFASGEEFRRLVADSNGPIQLEVEGEGRVRSVEVVPSTIRSGGAQDGGDEPARPSGP